MSSDFKTCLIMDDRIANLTDNITYAVMKGAQQITTAEFKSTSQSTSSIVFNVVVPSLETVIDRHVMLRATIRLKITGYAANTKQLINYGLRDCLGPFPLHQLINTMSCTINNNTVSANTRDLLPALLRMMDNRELARYNNTSPVAYDQYLNYSDMLTANNNSFSGVDGVSDPFIRPRGAFPLDQALSALSPAAALVVSGDATAVRTAYITFTVQEPLLLSPFLFGHPSSNNQGFYGIQNMSFNLNLGSANRVWRHFGTVGGGTSTIQNVEIDSVDNCFLQFTYLSVHPSQQLTSRCVVPYYEMSRYISNGGKDIPAYTAPVVVGDKATPQTGSFSSSTISLNQIPDKFIIYLRKPGQTWVDSDSFLPIRSINMNWNNASGVCSSFTQYDLWKCSVEAGSNQTWDEFRGFTSRQGSATETTAGTGAGVLVPTCGSVLMLDVGKHVNLIDDFYAPGSIGNFTFQITINCENYGAAFTPEIVIITMNSGSFATERGTSSTYTALLTKEDVLAASQQEPVSHSEARRMVGGGFLDGLKSVFRWFGNNHKAIGSTLGNVAKTGLAVNDIYNDGKKQHRNDKARAIISTLGGSRSGGSFGGGTLMNRLK